MRKAAIVLALAACSTAKPPPPLPPPPPIATQPAPPPSAPPPGERQTDGVLATKESKAVARTLVKVSQLRGLRATRPVPGVKLEREQLVGRVKEKALREFPPDVLRREGQLLQTFGFAPLGFDYLTEMMRLLEAQLEGFYEPQNGTMYLAADLRGKEAQATLAHELVHALQDQSWDLKKRSTYRPGKGDESMALACLAEGDATSLMMDFAMEDQNKTALDVDDDKMRAMMEASMGGTAKSVPHILQSSLISPYTDGLFFVQALRRKGGWAMVDSAWARPPTTTEHVLHLDKWEQHEPAIAIAAPSAATLGAGWKMEDEDTFGELGFALMFEEWMAAPMARAISAGWGGDRSAIWAKGDDLAFAVHDRYDASPGKPDGLAERAAGRLIPALKKRFGKASIDGADAVCFERKDLGPLLVARRGRDLVLTAGPTHASGTWASAGTCAQARKWADEILAMP